MGFGLLFIGYCVAYILSLTLYGYILRLLGYTIISWALFKLYEYNRKFIYPFAVSVFMMVFGLYSLFYNGMRNLSIAMPGWMRSSADVVKWIEFLGSIALSLSVLYVIMRFAKELGLKKQSFMAARNMVIVGLYFVLNFLGNWPLAENEIYINFFSLPMLLIQLIGIILNCILIFSCYMYICPEGDEEMARKKTRFKFLDNILAESDRRRDKATRETTEYYSEKIKKRRLEKDEKSGGDSGKDSNKKKKK